MLDRRSVDLLFLVFKTIDLGWKKITWFVEADLVKAFDRINHGVLRRELNRVVDEKRSR